MKLAWSIVSTTMLALALSAGTVPTAIAAEAQSQPVLLSDAPSAIPTAPLPSDNEHNPPLPQPPGTNDIFFLTYDKDGTPRVDTALSACAYYTAIQAVSGCDGTGGFNQPTTFKRWKKDVGLDKQDAADKVDVAHFINAVDLNLTRDHHMIYHGPNNTAGYVCNHTGPVATTEDPTALFPTPAEIDGLIKSIHSKATLVACVAMEYSNRTAPSAPPFVSFLIFDANGNLLPGVDLDGRGVKFVPNVCTACHGGTFQYETSIDGGQTVQFDHTKAVNGDLGAHFLPFDMANFVFSSKLTPAEQQEAIFKLNMDVYNTEITRTTGFPGQANPSVGSDSITQLIIGWYTDVTAANTNPQFKLDFMPTRWMNDPFPFLYTDVVSHSCRTCHTAMDRVPSEVSTPATFSLGLMQSITCGTTASGHQMPNSKVTFDRFWLSQQLQVTGRTAPTIDQPDTLEPGCPQP
jgi:hypothetical protein